MRRMLTVRRLCLGAVFSVMGAQVAESQGFHNHVAITLETGLTEAESFQLTVPEVVKTTIAISMVTVTQISMQTTIVSVFPTTTVGGLCVAISSLIPATSSALEANADKSVSAPSTSLQRPVSFPSIVINVISGGNNASADFAINTTSIATASASVRLLNLSSRQCDCRCLCPVSAFQVYYAYGEMPVSSTETKSTFRTLVSLVTAGQQMAISAAPSLTAESFTSFPSSSQNPIAEPASSSSSPTSTPKVPGGAPFDINTYSLLDAVTVALEIRELKPTGNP